ncbi:PEP-CTERM/exosortase system-associated acyltransferase [Thioalkalivibrio versutus]|uniref:PEP-CTERM/exosortase system-associated acyltransferase n=1 Tax=Thioalkalivibrio versutus TaxID=106634 RepID=UPI0003634E50|nr:PEP-CTERM/exosortase system-associated acyltransferase [Thioalkalivibrio versutus]OOC51319.1 N-acyl amino acid synthase, PEP-CTERM/exosortase system-associated [Thioalkalivibrio versutus]
MENDSVVSAFNRYFDLSTRTGQSLEEIQHLRYQVYCKEFGFEREEDCPGHKEIDEYDTQAWHCLLEHKPSAMAAGCVRVVHVDAHDPITQLPMERHCSESFFDSAWRPDRLDRDNICEVSRLAVHGMFRRRHGETATPFGDIEALEISPDQVRVFPILAVSLFVAATLLCVHHRKQHAFAMMEPALARILRHTGLEFTQIGEIVHYHGKRAAFYIDSGEAYESIRRSSALSELCRHVESTLLRRPHPLPTAMPMKAIRSRAAPMRPKVLPAGRTWRPQPTRPENGYHGLRN